MIRFIHTADWQMGAKFAHLGELASPTRDRRGETARRVVRLAEDREVDFLVIAGDMFEDHAVGSSTIQETLDALRQTAAPVFILPGNHDPLQSGGVWNRRPWLRAPGNVRLLEEETPVECGGALLYPCPLRQKRSQRDPTEWIPDRGGTDAIRIGIAHGALDVLGRDVNFPIHPNRAQAAGLDYLALGDWHSHYQYDERTFYSGTPEPTSFEERDPGQVLEIQIDAPGETPQVCTHRVNSLRWMTREHNISADPGLQELQRWVESLPQPGRTLVRLQLEGVVDLDTAQRIRHTITGLGDDLYYLDVQDTLQLAPGEQDLAQSFPAGPVGEAAKDLIQLTDGRVPDGPGRDFADRDPEVIERALHLLYAAVREVES